MSAARAVPASRWSPGSRRNSGAQPLVLVVIVTLLGGAIWMGVSRGGLARAKEDVVRGATVQRGPLRISVTERGNLKAADSVSLKNEIEGQSTILKLVPEGTVVQEGDLLCELDATQQVDNRFQQQISVRNAEAAHVKSKQNFQIQQSQNDSDVKRAEQALLFADMDLKKFREGERKAKEAEADEAIKLAEEEATRADEKLDWSQKLNEKGFLTETELEADRLSRSRAQIQLEQSKRDKDLLTRFQIPRDEADLVAKLEEARRELDRVNLQAAARLVDYEADMRTNEAKLELEREKLTKLETQIHKAKLYAPRAGMVVYAQEEGGRYGMSQPIKEGTQVRERQEIVTIPSAGGMIAQVSLHESVLKQIEPGQTAVIKVDALPDREFTGHLKFVAVMADQNTYWANPNLRLYRTEVTIDDASTDLRPSMSCAVEILVEEIADTLYVPIQAVFRRGSENLSFVDKGGKPEERQVAVGRFNERWVQVLSGLAEGETVLLAPPAGFTREVDEGTEAAGEKPAGAPTGAGPAMPVQANARPEGREGRENREARGEQAGEERKIDPARAAEWSKRLEGMSDEDKAKLMERAGRGGRSGEGRKKDDKGAGGG